MQEVCPEFAPNVMYDDDAKGLDATYYCLNFFATILPSMRFLSWHLFLWLNLFTGTVNRFIIEISAESQYLLQMIHFFYFKHYKICYKRSFKSLKNKSFKQNYNVSILFSIRSRLNVIFRRYSRMVKFCKAGRIHRLGADDKNMRKLQNKGEMLKFAINIL